MDLKALGEEKLGLVKEGRDMLERAETEKRALTQEDQNRWDAIFSRVEEIDATAARSVRLAEAERSLATSTGTVAARDGIVTGKETTEAPVGDPRSMTLDALAEKRSKATAGFMNQIAGAPATQEEIREFRSLQGDLDASGGYLVSPQDFVARLIKKVDDLTFIRQKATKFLLTDADSLGAPVLSANPSASQWTSEILTGSEDTAMVFGKRELRPHPLAKSIKISNTLLRKSAIAAEGLVTDRLAYIMGITEETAFLVGTGANQPLGVFTASSDGISTGQDVSSGNTSTAIGPDGLINARYNLKSQYWAKAEWIFNRTVLREVAKLKDGDGQYYWRPAGLGQGLNQAPGGMLLDAPVNVSEYAPNTMTTGLYAGIIGDFSNYWIADALNVQFQIVRELYAATNQTGIFVRAELDGAPTLEEAFTRVKLA